MYDNVDIANPYKDLHEIKKFMLGPESRALLFLQAKKSDTQNIFQDTRNELHHTIRTLLESKTD